MTKIMGRSNWTDGEVPNIFDFNDGVDSTTKGLWLGTRIFKRTLPNGTKVGIMLMDSQGLFDGLVTSGESVAMSGVSTVLSHLQMFNMKGLITSNYLEQIMTNLVPSRVKDSTVNNISGSRVMFVVRDFTGKKKYGSGLTDGSRYIENEQKKNMENVSRYFLFKKNVIKMEEEMEETFQTWPKPYPPAQEIVRAGFEHKKYSTDCRLLKIIKN